MASKGKLRELQAAARVIKGYLDQADRVAQAWVEELGLPVGKPDNDDYGQYAGKVVEELRRQCQAYKDFTARDKT